MVFTSRPDGVSGSWWGSTNRPVSHSWAIKQRIISLLVWGQWLPRCHIIWYLTQPTRRKNVRCQCSHNTTGKTTWKNSGFDRSHVALIAQLVEHYTDNAKIVGSDPVQSLNFSGVIFPVVLWLHSHLSSFHWSFNCYCWTSITIDPLGITNL